MPAADGDGEGNDRRRNGQDDGDDEADAAGHRPKGSAGRVQQIGNGAGQYPGEDRQVDIMPPAEAAVKGK